MKIINYNNILIKPYLTEKLSFISKFNNVLIWKVNKYCNKFKIINAIENIYNIKVYKIRTLIVKKIIKNKKRKLNKIKIWKKAYIFFNKKSNFNIDNI